MSWWAGQQTLLQSTEMRSEVIRGARGMPCQVGLVHKAQSRAAGQQGPWSVRGPFQEPGEGFHSVLLGSPDMLPGEGDIEVARAIGPVPCHPQCTLGHFKIWVSGLDLEVSPTDCSVEKLKSQ